MLLNERVIFEFFYRYASPRTEQINIYKNVLIITKTAIFNRMYLVTRMLLVVIENCALMSGQ